MQELHKPSPGLTSEQRRENATSVLQMLYELKFWRVMAGCMSEASGIPLVDVRKGTPFPTKESWVRFRVLMSEKFGINFTPKGIQVRDIMDEVFLKCPTWKEIVKSANENEFPDSDVW